MTNGNHATQSKHLEYTSAAIKRYVLEEILDVANAVAEELNGVNIGALDTVPATINGGVWIEQKNGVPELRFYYDDYVYYFSSTALDNPNLTLSTSSIQVTPGSTESVTLTYSGSGEISFVNPNPSALTVSYNSSTKTISLTNNQADSDDDVNVNLTVKLSEAGSYSHDFATLTVACAHASPELTLSSTTAIAARGSDPSTVTLSYLGSGTVSITNPNPSALTASYNSSTKTISLTNNQAEGADAVDVILTVNLSKAGAYAAESVTLTVSCVATQDPQLSLTGDRAYVASNNNGLEVSGSTYTLHMKSGYENANLTLSYLGTGAVTTSSSNSKLGVSWNSST
ncbi:MAG: hypothetical protein IJG24_05880, partial [Selenomonadaceae bacterium]|nr:hypothetical protein [Selenomonadaceae bacterium]